MRRKLGLVALAGFGTCVVCLSAAFAIGGHGIGDAAFGLSDGARCGFSPAGRSDSRTLAWNGGDAVVISVPAIVNWRAGDGDVVRVTGDAAMLPHLTIKDGRIGLDCNPSHWGNVDLTVTLPGRQIFRAYELRGAEEVHLSGLNQPALNIVIRGASQITADGKADDVGVDLRGAGDIDLGRVMAQNATVDIRGTGHVSIAPRGTARIDIRGAGSVKLVTEPRHVESSIKGFGSIDHAGRRS